jgi:hypothetical protein
LSDEQQHNAADTATEAAIDAHISGNAEKAAPLFNRATVEHQRAAASQEQHGGGELAWRDGTELAPMPEAPAVSSETDAAVAKLNQLGGRHSELVASWGADAPVNIEYARAAFREVVANDPDLVAVVDRSGIGNHPSVLEFLAKQGRLSAGLMNDHTIARSYEPMTINRTGPSNPSRGGGAREQLDQLMADNPPGSDRYKSPTVQRRVEALSRQIAGNGNVIGQGGRTS